MNSKTTTNAPQRSRRTDSGSSHIVISIVLFVLFAVSSVLMLLSAAAMLLADWLDSPLLSATVLGVFLLLLSAAVYYIWLRPSVMRISERLETIYSVADMTGQVFDWVKERIRYLRLLLSVIRSRW